MGCVALAHLPSALGNTSHGGHLESRGEVGGGGGKGINRLVQDELRLAWKVDVTRRQQQGAMTKSCSQVGQFPAAVNE